ncbi:MAG: ribonuclease III [Gemmatimonadota bacterium]|nr:ribonuclease III [Gemmatimonadota bacterium]
MILEWFRRRLGGAEKSKRERKADRASRLRRLEEILGHRFSSHEVLVRATTHPSYLDQSDSRGESYERLEFLGDSVLNLTVSRWLFERHPDAQEGVLSQMRAHIISRRFLAGASEAIELPDEIQTGDDPNLLSGGGRQKIAADALEGVIGALYLDGGFEVARRFIEETVLSRDLEREEGFHTAKNRLQETIHELGRGQLTYRTRRASSAPDGDRDDINFECQVWLEGEPLGSGWGRTKKEAEKEAAMDALERLERVKKSIPEGTADRK